MAQSVSHQQQLLRDRWLTSVSTPSPPIPTTSGLHHMTATNSAGGGRETIHSGHFMVSHFEAEAQDDEDTEISMPDPDESGAIVELNTCTDVQLVQPSNAIVPTSARPNTSAVIDISLTKLFKCMNLAYRQKLTSPKWNSFKGIRLRWKDKIRLNNLIWRCWHMQFIMRKKTLVCQFASPLDVEHNKPEAVVLEGKYWKRQFDVIKAEYMKWRKFYRNRGLGTNAILDTVSEIDIFDWSPLNNDKNLLGVDDYCWTTDTLFSTINSTPFPFPDPREIAKAGIADFIQPSLGPLQPNLDDFMNGIPLQELINTHLSTRLAPVPEEGTDDQMFRADVYDFPGIMGSEPMDASMMSGATITDVTNVGNVELESACRSSQQLTDPLLCATSSNAATIQRTSNTSEMLSYPNTGDATVLQYPNKMYNAQAMPTMQTNMNSMNLNSSTNIATQSQIQSQVMHNQTQNFMNTSADSAGGDLLSMGATKKRQVKGLRAQLFNRREPHNYDKTTPTQHQTNIYNQMLAAQQNRNQLQMQSSSQQQQQQQQQQLTNVGSGSTMFNSTNLYLTPQNVQTELQHTSPIQTTTNNYANALNLTSANNFSLAANQMNPNLMSMLPVTTQVQTQQQQTKSNSNLLSLLSMKSVSDASTIDTSQIDSYKAASSHSAVSYKPYPTQQSMKSSGYNQLSPRSVRMSSPPTHQQINANAATIDKEMFRSKSLPMNSTLQLPVMREEPFAMPKYQAAKQSSFRIRGRSSSMITKQPHHSTPSLQSATSEPMLKTLAQLLTSNSAGSSSVTNLQQSNVLVNANLVPTNVVLSQSHQAQHQHQQQQSQKSPFSNQYANQFQSQPLSPDQKFASSSAASSSSSSMPSALSPGGSSGGDSMQRRVGHIHAEQKRRYNIKNGFDMLHSLIPQLQQNPNAKLSKAAMLQKGAEYIKQLRTERDAIKQKMEILRKERDTLNNSLNHLHSVLPANGAPVARQRTSRVKDLYNDYVREKTLQSWKFWILGLIFEPLLNSYNTTVSVASMEELYRSTMIWVDQHCSLIEIRPAVSDKLRYLSTTTDILSDPPSTLQDEVLKAISSTNSNNSTNLL